MAENATFKDKMRAVAASAMLDAAEAALLELGQEGATIQHVAERVGCAPATLYLYFKNKEDLFNALVQRHTMQMLDSAQEELERDGLPLERIRRAIARFLTYTLQNRAFFQYFFTAVPMRHSVICQSLAAETRDRQETYGVKELALLRQAQQDGQIRPDIDPAILQDFMVSVCLSFCERTILNAVPVDNVVAMELLWGLLYGGIGNHTRDRA